MKLRLSKVLPYVDDDYTKLKCTPMTANSNLTFVVLWCRIHSSQDIYVLAH